MRSGSTATRAQPQPRLRRHDVPHRPGDARFLGSTGGGEREPLRGRQRVQTHEAAAEGEGAHDRGDVHRRLAGERPVEQHVVAGDVEERDVRRETHGAILAHGDLAVRVGARDRRRRASLQHLVPARAGSRWAE